MKDLFCDIESLYKITTADKENIPSEKTAKDQLAAVNTSVFR